MQNTLSEIAYQLRVDILKMYYSAGWGHLASALSCVDIFTTLYYGDVFQLDTRFQRDCDRVILSKGHGCAAWYAVLSRLGYFPHKELLTFYKKNSRLFGLASSDVPGIDIPTGSLGQGICFATGTALAAKLDGLDYKTYVILGDGESQEGSVYEAAMFAGNKHLDNLIVILDHNGLQASGRVEEIASLSPIAGKWEAFGWDVLTADGHDYNDLQKAMHKAKKIEGKPCLIIAQTIKGKGLSFMENHAEWHSKRPTEAEWKMACSDMNITMEELAKI